MFEVQSVGVDTGPQLFFYSFIALSILRCTKSTQTADVSAVSSRHFEIWCEKHESLRTPVDENRTISRSLVLTQYQRVTDDKTDTPLLDIKVKVWTLVIALYLHESYS